MPISHLIYVPICLFVGLWAGWSVHAWFSQKQHTQLMQRLALLEQEAAAARLKMDANQAVH